VCAPLKPRATHPTTLCPGCRCAFERGSDDTRCQFYKNAYESLCPPDWVSACPVLRMHLALKWRASPLCCVRRSLMTRACLPVGFVPQVEEWEELRSQGLWYGKY
jgi:hypothetical protein